MGCWGSAVHPRVFCGSEGDLAASEMWTALQPWRLLGGGGGTPRWPWPCSVPEMGLAPRGAGVRREGSAGGFASRREGSPLG